MPNSKLNKLKSETKYGTEVTLNLSSFFIGNSNEETNFPHRLLLTNTHVLRLSIKPLQILYKLIKHWQKV